MALHPLIAPCVLGALVLAVLAGLTVAGYAVHNGQSRLAANTKHIARLQRNQDAEIAREKRHFSRAVYILCIDIGHGRVKCEQLSRGVITKLPKLHESKTGKTGSSGKKGTNGKRGPSGLTITGETGAKGERGSNGTQGPEGSRGPRGERGPVGARGPQGAQGPVGPQGVQGPPGKNDCPGHWIMERSPPLGTVYVCVP